MRCSLFFEADLSTLRYYDDEISYNSSFLLPLFLYYESLPIKKLGLSFSVDFLDLLSF
jgi:hypothetical protein